MDTKRMAELSVMIINLRKAAEELAEIWDTHAHDCMYLMKSDDLDEYDLACTHSDPSCDPVCIYDNCPLLK